MLQFTSRHTSVKHHELGGVQTALACEQALRGALVAGREKEWELATTSLEFEYQHWKSRCEMLIGGDDISNDVITLGVCFHAFSNACLHSPSFALRADWRKSDSSVDGEPQVNWRQNSPSGDVVASSPSFSCPAARAPRIACSQAKTAYKWTIDATSGVLVRWRLNLLLTWC